MLHRRFTFRFILIALLIVIFLSFLSWWAVPFTHNLLGGIFSPVQKVFSGVSYRLMNIGEYWKNYEELNATKTELTNKLNELDKKMVDYNTIKQENEDLKKELKFISNYKNFKTLVAPVISQSLLPENQVLIINKGDKDNVKEGDSVISDGNLIGIVGKTDDYTSQVILMTDNNSQVAGRIQNEAKTSGMIKGEHGLGLILDMIPKDELVALGDYVVTSGLDKNVPAQLLIGKVSEIKNSPEDVFQKIIITPLINYHKIDLVTIILGNE